MADNTPADVTPPTLTMAWGTDGPPMDGSSPGAQPANPDAPPATMPVVPAYVVAPGSIADANRKILGQLSSIVSVYEALKDKVNSEKAWVFDTPSADALANPAPVYTQDPFGNGSGYLPGSDPHPDWTRQWSGYADKTLLQAADAIELVGQYVQALNEAGQLYTQADKSSFLSALKVSQAD